VRIDDLSDEQRRVADDPFKFALVLGGAGTGKTTAALWAARQAIERGEVKAHQRVLFLTFSRTAVSQIAVRAKGVLSGVSDAIEVSTFHAFGLRMLQDFGRYAGRGTGVPRLQSAARKKLLGNDNSLLSYDDLVPAACTLVQASSIAPLVAERWPLVICDEFQDTSPAQWDLLQSFARQSRILLLADPNQMIYTFVDGVGAERLQTAQALADQVIELQPASFRDPSGCIPAMAAAVRERRFSADEVLHASATGRLVVYDRVTDDQLVDIIKNERLVAREAGNKSLGIFGHSNEGVARLGATLTEHGIDHALVGISEAHGEALAAMSALCAFGVDLVDADALAVAMATYLTACTRGQTPTIALGLAFGRPTLPDAVRQRFEGIRRAMTEAAGQGREELVTAAVNSWHQLGLVQGNRPWGLAALRFAAAAQRLPRVGDTTKVVQQLMEEAERLRNAALVSDDLVENQTLQIMNFHQTKGREADHVILLYREGDYLADRRAVEPYVEASRILYVALTRARSRVVVVLPETPHALVAPFRTLASA
jgi:DNA helicase-2/ATP-dependent DNA helicase PcrA